MQDDKDVNCHMRQSLKSGSLKGSRQDSVDGKKTFLLATEYHLYQRCLHLSA